LAEKGLEGAIRISAKSGEGRETLEAAIDSRFTDGELDLRYDAVVADARQYSAILRAVERLDSVLSSMKEGYALDLCCIDAESAMAEFGEINGRNVNEDIVASIFSRFCVGK
jgi:tRNA modification GTPase